MYQPPSVISNAVLFQYADRNLCLTLVSDSINKEQWGLPTAMVSKNQTSLASLDHALHNEIKLNAQDISYREQLYTSELQVGQQSIVCISYLYLSRDIRWSKGDAQVGVFSLDKLPRLSEQDQSTIRYALARLHAKTLYSSILSFLLPKTFDLTQYQDAFETITRQKLDKRNFRKKVLQLNILEQKSAGTSTKQPSTYSFRAGSLTFLAKPFPYKGAKQ